MQIRPAFLSRSASALARDRGYSQAGVCLEHSTVMSLVSHA